MQQQNQGASVCGPPAPWFSFISKQASKHSKPACWLFLCLCCFSASVVVLYSFCSLVA